MSELKIMSTKIVVAPAGAPRLIYRQSVLIFGSERNISDIYLGLMMGETVRLSEFRVEEFKAELPSILLSERPLSLIEHPSFKIDGIPDYKTGTEWLLTMP